LIWTFAFEKRLTTNFCGISIRAPEKPASSRQTAEGRRQNPLEILAFLMKARPVWLYLFRERM